MSHQITITVSDEVYKGLQTVAGGRTMSELIEELARPIVSELNLEASYKNMILDDEREQEAAGWIERAMPSQCSSRWPVL